MDFNTTRRIHERHTRECLMHMSKAPVKIVRGSGQYMFDHEQVEYLDCVNIQAHVGHCHPTINSVAVQQMWAQNSYSISTGDKDENVAARDEYVKGLRSTLPPELSEFFFTDSGSEANDLALRLARASTNLHDCIVLDAAFHGRAGLASFCSPRNWKKLDIGKEDWVHVLPLPDLFRGVHRESDPDAVDKYIAESLNIIRRIHQTGRKFAAFLVEPLPLFQGVLMLPQGWLRAVADEVRKIGGLLIIDEVNSGFGRTGHNFWGYQMHDIQPDILVLGKAMANGYPMGGVVTTSKIASALKTNCGRFDSSYKGHSMALSIAISVLEIIKNEQLLDRARQVGQLLRHQLLNLSDRYGCIGDVRGAGMFIGIDIILNEANRKPDPVLAERIVYRMKNEQNIIVGLVGDLRNVILVTPPICFDMQNADRFVTAFEKALRDPEPVVSPFDGIEAQPLITLSAAFGYDKNDASESTQPSGSYSEMD